MHTRDIKNIPRSCSL